MSDKHSPWRVSGVMSKIGCCMQGFRAAMQEKSLWYVCILDAALVYRAQQIEDSHHRIIYTFIAAFPITIELINSAIERTVDRIGYEFSELSRDAKDIAAAASMYAHVLGALTVLSA